MRGKKQDKKITLVVLSAGIGKRFGGLKQIKPVGPSGEVLLDYSLYAALRAGFSKVIFVIRKEIEKGFRKVVGEYWEKKTEVHYAYQELDSFIPKVLFFNSKREKPWGTAHALLVCREMVDAPFSVINADDFYGLESFELIALNLSNLAEENEYLSIAYKLKDTLSPHGYVSRAICKVDENSYLKDIREIKKIHRKEDKIIGDLDGEVFELDGEESVSMNLFGFTPSIFFYLDSGFKEFLKEKSSENEEFGLPEFLDSLLKRGVVRIKIISTPSRWFGITHPDDLEIVKIKISELIKEGRYPEKIRI